MAFRNILETYLKCKYYESSYMPFTIIYIEKLLYLQ